jgi:hypothetical protein
MELTPTTTSRGSRLKQSFLAVYCVVAAILLASTVVMPYRLSAIEGDAPSPAVVSPAPDEVKLLLTLTQKLLVVQRALRTPAHRRPVPLRMIIPHSHQHRVGA